MVTMTSTEMTGRAVPASAARWRWWAFPLATSPENDAFVGLCRIWSSGFGNGRVPSLDDLCALGLADWNGLACVGELLPDGDFTFGILGCEATAADGASMPARRVSRARSGPCGPKACTMYRAVIGKPLLAIQKGVEVLEQDRIARWTGIALPLSGGRVLAAMTFD